LDVEKSTNHYRNVGILNGDETVPVLEHLLALEIDDNRPS
jgi:hypothetical protein